MLFFQFLVVKPNEHQIEDVKRLAKEIGVDQVRFKTAQVYDYENDPNHLIPSIDKYSRYKKDKDGKMAFKGIEQSLLEVVARSCYYMGWRVVPCCFDKDAHHQLGNLKVQCFKEIWHNDNYQQFRSQVLQAAKTLTSAPIALKA